MIEEGFRKVLIIAYYYAPLGLSGVQRALKFSKYLHKFGWMPTVLTVEPAGYYALDESLLQEAEEAGVKIIRTQSHDLNHILKKKLSKIPHERTRKFRQLVCDFLFIPDEKKGWRKIAVKKGIELIKKEKFDLLFATAPPQTDFLIGMDLKKIFGIPLIVDYRDIWLDNKQKYFPTFYHKLKHKRLEKKVLKAADKVIVTHRRIKETILIKHPSVRYNDVIIIPPSYDKSDIDGIAIEKRVKTKMSITHSGTFFGNRNPSVLLNSVAYIFKTYPKMRGRLEVNLIGKARDEDKRLVKKLDLDNAVNFIDFLPHRQCLQKMCESDMLWFIIDNDYQAPAKLFEYFGTRRPIVASIVDGYTKQLLLESKSAVCVPIKDVDALSNAIMEQFRKFEQKKLETTSLDFISKFNALNITAELAKQFESLMNYENASSLIIKG